MIITFNSIKKKYYNFTLTSFFNEAVLAKVVVYESLLFNSYL